VPNGYHGTKEEWRVIEAPLREIDPLLDAFASASGYVLTKNYRGDPERSLVRDAGIRRLIQVFVAETTGPHFKVWLCASEDRQLKRYWQRRFITESATPSELSASITQWLAEGKTYLESLTSSNLEFATNISTFKL
jgi:hypothetical protein